MRLPSRMVGLAGAASFALAAAAAAPMLAQDESVADRSETVAGWRIEDVADISEDDPVARIIRISRELENQELSYEIRLSGYGGTGWGSTSYSAAIGWENRSCNRSGGAAVETGAPAQRAARVRAALVRELGRLEASCGAPAGTAAPLLEGFEAAFARLSSWHGERLAEIAAWAAEADEARYPGGNDMAMDGNLAMDMDMGLDMNASTDMNATEMTDMGTDANYTATEVTDMNSVGPEPEAAPDEGRKRR